MADAPTPRTAVSRMTAGSLTPALALAYLRELSIDVRAAVVLDGDGAPLAGEAELAERARAALARHDGASGAWIERSDAGALVVARAGAGLAIAVLAADFALLELLAHDLETVVGDLAGGD